MDMVGSPEETGGVNTAGSPEETDSRSCGGRSHTRHSDPQARLLLGSAGSGLSHGDATHTFRTSLGYDLIEFRVLPSDVLGL